MNTHGLEGQIRRIERQLADAQCSGDIGLIHELEDIRDEMAQELYEAEEGCEE